MLKQPLVTNRSVQLEKLAQAGCVDLLVIGGGATGLGIAVDAVTRGLTVALLEAGDFTQGASSKATKLIHGGVRYLAQGNIGLVREALHERSLLLANAPHLVGALSFVMPSYHLWETPLYGAGLRMYDALAGNDALGATRILSQERVKNLLPNVQLHGLRGGVQYWDGQFDDARLGLALARTAAMHGAHILNYCQVQALLNDSHGRVCGVRAFDVEGRQTVEIEAGCVMNATGVWVDDVLALNEPDQKKRAPMMSPSQGAHVVVDREFWPSEHALLVPKTRDGRVLFAVPWLGKTILGTTDIARPDKPLDPVPMPQEVSFILEEAGRYLSRPPKMGDIRSAWAGLRPLVRPQSVSASTKQMSREHAIAISDSGLVTVTGGKWTTYRAIAEDVIRQCQLNSLLPVKLAPCKTQELLLVGGSVGLARTSLQAPQGIECYGSEAAWVEGMQGAEVLLDEKFGLTEAMVRFAVRHEYARTVEDVLARRHRVLFLDACAAGRMANKVAALMAEELGRPVDASALTAQAMQYALQ